jgi:hypothetical protein
MPETKSIVILVNPLLRVAPGGNLHDHQYPRDSQVGGSEIVVVLEG